MRILINALSARLGGGQTYLLNLLKHVPQEDGLQVAVIVQPTFHLTELPSNVTLIKQAALENPWKRTVWEEMQLPALLREYDAELFFSPGGLLPRSLPGHILTAVTFQNMLPFDHVQRKKYPFGYRRLRDWLLERGLSSSMRRADLVIFISEFARDFIRHELGQLQGQSVVAPHGIHPSFRAGSGVPLPRPAWLPKEEYFLYVSFIDHYKAQLEVVRGFSLYHMRGGKGKLVLAGPEYRPYGDLVRQEIAQLGLADWVLMVGNVPHGELPAAYQNAKINVFASHTENCPNILLEMMASGRPALVSRRGPMPEFGKDAVEYFDPSDPEDFALHLAGLAADEERQHSLAKAALEQVSGYTWEQAASVTWRALIDTKRSKRRGQK
jgi:glycosyltransferase involved in cell wall biosynthesis